MSYVAKLTLEGNDIGTATPEQCVIHSSYPPPKAKLDQESPHIAKINVAFTGTITQGNEQTVYSAPHGYGYVPLTFSNIYFDDGLGIEASGLGWAGIGATLIVKAYCDSTNFYVTIFDDFNWTSSSANLTVEFYIFAENGT